MNSKLILFLLESLISLSLLYGFYYVFLKRLSFHGLKRAFLIGSLFVSLLLPFAHIPIGDNAQLTNINEFVYIEEELSAVAMQIAPATQIKTNAPIPTSEGPLLPIIYISIIGILLLRSLLQIRYIYRLKNESDLISSTPLQVYQSHKIKQSFSFLKNIFIQPNLSAYEKEIIIQHELSHIKKRHYIDLMLAQIFVLLQWFNPFIYLIRNAIQEVHEYQADQETLQKHDNIDYQKLLASQIHSSSRFVLTSSFNSFTLKRLQMMTQEKSKIRNLFILLLLIPLLCTLILSFSKSPTIQESFSEIVANETTHQFENPINFTPLKDSIIIQIKDSGSFRLLSDSTIHTTIHIASGSTSNPIETMTLVKATLIYEEYEYTADSAVYYENIKQVHLFGNATKTKRIELAEHIPNIYPTDTNYSITSAYGERIHPIFKTKKMHKGIDIAAPLGTNVYVTANGIVDKVENRPKGAGKLITIKHGPIYSTMYSQLSEQLITVGQKVIRGDIIGKIGSSGMSTGPHLHYEIKKNGENVNPEDYL